MIEENGIYKHKEYKDTKTLEDGSTNLMEMLQSVTKNNGSDDYLGTVIDNKIIYESYEKVFGKIVCLGEFIKKIKKLLNKEKDNNYETEVNNSKNNTEETIHVEHKANINYNDSNYFGVAKEIIGIFSINRADWIISEYAIYYADSTNCPLYSTFGVDSIRYIIEETEMRICFVNSLKAESLYKDVLCDFKGNLKVLISFDDLSDSLVDSYSKIGIQVFMLKDIIYEFFKTKNKTTKRKSDESSINSESSFSGILEPNSAGERSYNAETSSNKLKNDSKENKCNEINKDIHNNAFGSVNTDTNNSKKIESNILENEEFSKIRRRNLEENIGIETLNDRITKFTKRKLSSYDFSYIDGKDIATVCYTSGTSGKPKGVLLSHTNFISAVSGFIRGYESYGEFALSKNDVYISYLPLAHVMERFILTIITAKGYRVVFYRGNPKILQQDMKLIQPTVFVGVPRVFNVFKERIEEEIAKRGFFAKFIVKSAVKYKVFWQKYGYYNHYLLDNLIFKKIAKEFGGKLKAALNGSAPLSSNVSEFLQAVFSMKIFQGYGQTEAMAANMMTTTWDHSNDGVGIPFPVNLVKLIPSDDYNGTLKGEICIKGNNVTCGYFKNPESTKELFTKDGWLKTGDIGVIDQKNTKVFKIVGRRKEIFKTSLGEYIVPEKIENLLRGGIVEDIVITGRTTGDFIMALIVCKNREIEESEIYNHIVEKGQKLFEIHALTRFEIPRKIYVIREDFEFYGDMLTPTMKKKRSKIEKYFESQIDSSYKA